jgi:hypothetical protein
LHGCALAGEARAHGHHQHQAEVLADLQDPSQPWHRSSIDLMACWPTIAILSCNQTSKAETLQLYSFDFGVVDGQ